MPRIIKNMHGRTMPLVLILVMSFAVLIAGTLFNSRNEKKTNQAKAETAATTLNVLNTPPNWNVDAEEYVESSTGTPTNITSSTIWVGTGQDDNNEPYYLLICQTASAPTANPSAAPNCNGGQWAVSVLTTSLQVATATRVSAIADAESNAWFAWICDENGSNPTCNPTYKQGNGNFAKSSPFYVNHRPAFTIFTDNSPWDPGLTATWTASSVDYDVTATSDEVRLVVCKANDFSNGACGAGGTYCTSLLFSTTPTCAFALEAVKPDGDYTAYGFVYDTHGLIASGGAQGTDSVLTVNNVTSSISAASITLNDADDVGDLTLVNEQATSSGFHVKYTVTDANSCQTLSAGNEITNGRINVYRSGIGSAACDGLDVDEFNANNCYTGSTTSVGRWRVAYAQDPDQCSGISDDTTNWTATFTLWYLADPTDGSTASDTPWFAENWLASAMAYDDDGATSTLVQSSTGKEVVSFLAIDLLTSTIAYGSLAPGSQTDPVTVTTTLEATGNVGLDEALSGQSMCTTYPTCSGAATDTIHVANQRYATSSNPYISYASASSLTTTSSPETELNGPKTTNTNTPTTANTFWGIRVPSAITKAGDYTGQNTIIGVKSEGSQW